MFLDPVQAQLRYLGRRASVPDPSGKVTLAVADVAPIPGESRMGWYELATGELTEDADEQTAATRDQAAT